MYILFMKKSIQNISKLLFELRCLSVCLSEWVSFCKKIFFVQNGSNSQIRWTDISNSRIQARRAWRLVNYKPHVIENQKGERRGQNLKNNVIYGRHLNGTPSAFICSTQVQGQAVVMFLLLLHFLSSYSMLGDSIPWSAWR